MHGNLYLIHNLQQFGPSFQAHWKRAQTVCMYSVLKAAEKDFEKQRKTKRPVFKKYAVAVTSFVESYVAANQSYPKISEVVCGTGGTRSTIKRILSELNFDKKALEFKEAGNEGPDIIRIKGRPASMADSACPCVDGFEALTPNVVNAEIDVLSDDANFTPDAEQLATEVESAQVEVSNNFMDSKYIDIDEIDFSESLKRNGPSEPAFLTLLDQVIHSNNKADANRRVAPLMEVLQQRSSSSSRRVNLSASAGIQNDLSWDQTLNSIMPLSAGAKEDTFIRKDEQPEVGTYSTGQTSSCSEKGQDSSEMPLSAGAKEDAFSRKDEQPEVGTYRTGQTSSCSEKGQDSSENASNFKYTVKVMASKAKSLLSHLSGSQLKNLLRKEAEVFKDLKSIKIVPGICGSCPYAILQFRNSKSMKGALNLNSIKVRGERLSLQEGWLPSVDLTTCLEKTSIFHQILQGMNVGGPQKKAESVQSLTYVLGEDEKTNAYIKTHPVSSGNFSQTITIEECPSSISDKSIESFFSVFGKVQTSSVHHTNTKKQTVYVDFKNEHDKEKALKVQQFTVDGCSFRIKPDVSSGAVAVRLKRQTSSIDQKAAFAACRQYGSLKDVLIRNPETVDLFFGEKDRDRMAEILQSLRGDECLKGKFKVAPVWETYTKSEVFEAYHKEKVETLLSSLEELVTQLSGMLAPQMQALNQLVADVKHLTGTHRKEDL